mmetsp:Transcript_28361/g.41202  ORF Transcript_28361/g.41202 Transcript_28361/m.41202 type:complete len:390 (-) Transcript_28361:815-1984(-)
MSRTKTFRLLLEASLIFLPLVYFLVIFLKQISVTSLVAIGTLLVGVILTSWETISFLHKETISVCHIIREKINTIVLDDVLRAIFSVDSEGLVMGVISSFVGTAGMYALPLNVEQRVRITQSCLDCCLEPSSLDGGGGGGDVSRNESAMKIDAGLILTKPGGFLSLLPTDWRTVLWTSLDESDTSEKDDVATESEALLLMDNQHDKKRAMDRIDDENLPNENDNILMAQDMVWDDTDDDGDTDTTLNTADDSGISTNASPSSTSSSNKSSNTLSISRDQNVSSIVPNTPRTMPNMTNNDSNNTNDPFFHCSIHNTRSLCRQGRFFPFKNRSPFCRCCRINCGSCTVDSPSLQSRSTPNGGGSNSWFYCSGSCFYSGWMWCHINGSRHAS